MNYTYMISVEVGDLFCRAFSPVSWLNSKDGNTLSNYLQYGKIATKSLLKFSAPNIAAVPFPQPHLPFAPMQKNLLVHGTQVLVRGITYTNIECGGAGDCFFLSISRGLADFNIHITHSELRVMLAEWLEDTENSTNFQLYIRANPPDVIPYLGHMGNHCPSKKG